MNILKYKYYVNFISFLALILFSLSCAKEPKKVEIEMVEIPAGTFIMGCPHKIDSLQISKYEKLTYIKNTIINSQITHEVRITKSFLIGKYEITQKQYFEIMKNNPSHFKGDSLPVEEVTWYDAIEFCNKLSEMQGLQKCYIGGRNNVICDWEANGYRLPTEAEWEYACRGGTSAYPLYDFVHSYFEIDSSKLHTIAWTKSNSNDRSHPVGKKVPNSFGLYDMIGNVSERCFDSYEFYTNSLAIDPRNSRKNRYQTHIIRGGSFQNTPYYSSYFFRFQGGTTVVGSNNTGFRIAKNCETK